MQFGNVTFYLQLFQNIGYIPWVVQYILEPILHPAVCISHSPANILHSLCGNHGFVLYIHEFAAFFVIFTSLLYFLDSTNKRYHIVFFFLCLTYFSQYNALQGHTCCCKYKISFFFKDEQYFLILYIYIYIAHEYIYTHMYI